VDNWNRYVKGFHVPFPLCPTCSHRPVLSQLDVIVFNVKCAVNFATGAQVVERFLMCFTAAVFQYYESSVMCV